MSPWHTVCILVFLRINPKIWETGVSKWVCYNNRYCVLSACFVQDAFLGLFCILSNPDYRPFTKGFPGDSDAKIYACSEETGFNPWVREDPLENEMATHSSILAWKNLWIKEPDRLQSMGSERVGHDLTRKQRDKATTSRIILNFLSLKRLLLRQLRYE